MGEVLIDFLPLEERGRTVGFRMHPGGSLLNVAVACARLGQPVALATTIATDFFGRYLRAYAEGEGIDSRWLIDLPALSTLAFVAHEGGEPVFTFYGEGTADTLLTPEALPDELFSETAILHIGSISLLRGSTPDAVLAAVERLRGRALISLDPNLRPGLVKDEPGYRALLARLVGLVDLVKISAADLGWLMPGIALDEAARSLLALGPALVVVTRGGAGVLAVRAADAGRSLLNLPAFRVAVADTVGAGDSFNGGLLTCLAEAGAVTRGGLEALPDSDLVAALRYAAAVAAINCTRPGADPPRRAEVEAFLAHA
jgi:fructokinase